MNIAILHYHLRPGGVFQVIANQLQSLNSILQADDSYRVAVLHGEVHDEVPGSLWPSSSQVQVSTQAIAGLGYDQNSESGADAHGLATRLLQTLRTYQFFPKDTVIHVHNHALGKNASLPRALKIVAEEGYPLLLQIHDFVEDFRVEQYQHLSAMLRSCSSELSHQLYPQAPHIHYAVLNGRDYRILSESGLQAERLHLLANPIVAPADLPDPRVTRHEMQVTRGIPMEEPLVIYPVRGIRRKNLGELLLWSALFKNRASFGTTLAPRNDAEKPSYERWQSLADRLDLPCHFELGDSFSFQQNLAAADALITTSVAEGFGMVFLESQLMGRRLLGRDLPEITEEFSENGVDLRLLYSVLAIPIEMVGKERLLEGVTVAYGALIKRFSLDDHYEKSVRSHLERVLASGTVDFGFLTPALQEEVILRAHTDRGATDRVLELNPLLEKSLFPQDAQSGMGQASISNREAVQKHYGLSTIGMRLQDIYQNLRQSPRDAALCSLSRSDKILKSFLSLERFRPVRSMS